MLHFVVTRVLVELLWDQKVPGSNPGAPIVRRISSATTSAVELGAVGDCKCGAGLNKMSHSDILSYAPVGHPAHTCVGQATYSTDSRVGEREPHEARGKGDGPRRPHLGGLYQRPAGRRHRARAADTRDVALSRQNYANLCSGGVPIRE